jgi:hypothetical protein
LLDGVDGDLMLGLEVELFGLPVEYSVFPILHADGPAEFFIQVFDKGGDGVDLAEFFGLRVRQWMR